MLLLKWRSYTIEMKLVEYSNLWYSNLNKNLTKFTSTLEIYLKNSNLKNNVNIKLLSYFLFVYYNFKTHPQILYTKKNIITYKIRKDTPRGLCVYFNSFRFLKLIKFLNYQKGKVIIDNKISKERVSGQISNFFDYSNFKSLIINDKSFMTQIKSNFRLNNVYLYSFSLNILFLKKFDIFSKESYLVLKQISLWNNFSKFNKIISMKLILNKIFLNNIIINDIFKESLNQNNYNFYSYSNFKLIKPLYGNNLTYLKGKMKLKEMKINSLTGLSNIKKEVQKISFLLYNKKMYRLYYFMNYFISLKQSKVLIDWTLINLIKIYLNKFDLIQFKF